MSNNVLKIFVTISSHYVSFEHVKHLMTILDDINVVYMFQKAKII